MTRYFGAAAGMDCATYIAVTGVPFRALEFGASPLILGLLPATFSLVYVGATLLTGRLSDRMPRIGLARLGATFFATSALLLLLARGLPFIFLAMPLAAVGLSLFWPSLQAGLAEADSPRNLNRNLGRFNVSWSLGKGTGFALGGLILARFGFSTLFVGALGLALLVALVLRTAPAHPAENPPSAAEPLPTPRVDIPSDATPAAATPTEEWRYGPEVRRGFLRMAWIANALAYGVVATLNYHYPKYLESLGLGAALYGAFQALVYLTETITFLALQRSPGWHYRATPLFVSQLFLALLVLAIPFVRSPVLLLLLAPGIGAVLGLSYYSSLYYSLHAAEARGKNTGLHEAVLGSGSLIVPFIGGSLATATGSLVAPYAVCALLLGLGLIVQAGLERRFRYPNGTRSVTI